MLFKYLDRLKDRMRDWTVSRARSTHAKAWLFGLSVAESSFFPVPPDVLLIAMLMAGVGRWKYYALMTTVGSLIGGMLGYAIGAIFFGAVGESLIAFYGLEESLLHVTKLFEANAFWAIFISGFTPIPYKVFTITAGFFGVDFLVFMVASLLGRGMRFFLVAYLTKLFGKQAGALLYKYFNIVSIALVVVIIALIFLAQLL